MGNKITVVQYKLLRSGVEVRGYARSDRGTKYIAASLVVPFGEGRTYPTHAALERAVATVCEGKSQLPT